MSTILQWVETVATSLLAVAAVFGVWRYWKDRRWTRSQASCEFYDKFDQHEACHLAMFMMDYVKLTFIFTPPFLRKKLTIPWDSQLRAEVFSGRYENVSDDKVRAVRYLFDVYIGYLERVFYLFDTGVFRKKELLFYKYWLDKLISTEWSDLLEYARNNSCGIFVPFLERYRRMYKERIEHYLESI
jgi:hypothetical protein